MTATRVVRCLPPAMALALACGDSGGRAGDGGPDVARDVRPGEAGADAGGTGAPSVEARCEALCTRLAKLQCPPPAAYPNYCKDDCLLQQSYAPWCDTEGRAAIDCLTQQPDSSFECGPTGAEAKDGVCQGARDVFQQCLFEGPLPDMTEDCAAYSSLFSGLVASLGCGMPLSKSECLTVVGDRFPCNGALAIYIHCNAHEPASSFQCNEGGPAPKPDARCAPYAFPLGLCLQPRDPGE